MLHSISRRVTIVAATLAFALGVPLGIVIAGAGGFNDVPPTNPFYNDINAIAGAGVTAGCGGGNYCPKENVTREQMAAFMRRGFGYAYDDEQAVTLSLTGTPRTILSLTVKAGTVTGGTARVKIDIALAARITSNTGCPCAAQFNIMGKARTLQVEQVVGSFGIENGSMTFIDTIPTGVPVDYEVTGIRFSGTGTIYGGGQMTAITAPFGG